MPIIRPLSEFQTRTEELLKSCQEHDQPIFLTENGYGSVVLMSQTVFDRMQFKTNLFKKLDEAKQSIASGDKGITRAELRRRAKAKIARARRK
ncbi:MAG: type II toxin-antitoxin system Phd/YefM family antitoxin [candidate division KSB1 bacterium]|nr:type II toxin-antitoxin system Phd/YefM family antitoxin [candidate division KSB1 bacterium]MDZ7366355.1 type II toxin-antitoxin system Phd/YefM family antitoxin [candidate division KSB1 bacterium]MDZ7404010.1 type II toxin-antitoxin system Phd/YefM family antitoxin [candidate division KSB1 bacterium]